MAETEGSGSPGWERQTLERLALATLEEQRRARRWKIVRFFVLLFVVFVVLAVQSIEWSSKPLASRYTALVDMQGVIAPDQLASADNVIAGLRAAFEDSAAAGVILRVNSPGGSPVQSA